MGFNYNFCKKKPELIQLLTNFRSHNKILELANSIVTPIEIFYPKTIDKLKKERSNIDGPKPILLESTEPELLYFTLCNEQKYLDLQANKNTQ